MAFSAGQTGAGLGRVWGVSGEGLTTFSGGSQMPTVQTIERKIGEIEHFDVIIRQNGADVRGDRVLPKQYSGERASSGNRTVSDWRRTRFSTDFPGFDVDVLMANGEKARGNTLLSNVRASYEEAEE